MKFSRFIFVPLLFMSLFNLYGQNRALTFQRAEEQGIPYLRLDSMYKSAVHSDTTLAVFQTPEEQERLQKAYGDFIHQLGLFLNKNNFKWENQTRCFNRIYLNSDGTVDHFLYHFQPNAITVQKEKEFDRLVNLFVQDHKFPITANEKFAQCSPIKYVDIK